MIEQAIDILTSIVCVFGAVTGVWLTQRILKEKSPLVQWQRAALLVLSGFLFTDGVLTWPYAVWIEGHRLSAIATDFSVTFLLLIMSIRGRIILQNKPENIGLSSRP